VEIVPEKFGYACLAKCVFEERVDDGGGIAVERSRGMAGKQGPKGRNSKCGGATAQALGESKSAAKGEKGKKATLQRQDKGSSKGKVVD